MGSNVSQDIGTYFILSRNIFDSAIWRDDPHILKLFVYLLGNARHAKKPKKYPKVTIKRGEIVRSLSQIADDNEYTHNNSVKRWSRGKVSSMLKSLEKQGYIKIASDTYGTHLSICNYDVYQTPVNYTSDSSKTACEQLSTTCDINNNEYNGKNEKNEDIYSDESESKPIVVKTYPPEVIKIVSDFITKKSADYSDHPALKNPKLDSWYDTIEKINRIDGHSFKTIREVIRFSIYDSFWCDQVISLAGLRNNGKNKCKKFDNIRVAMNKRPIKQEVKEKKLSTRERLALLKIGNDEAKPLEVEYEELNN
jgi:hypothetical protein